MPKRSRKLAARLWWFLLPFAGETGYPNPDNPPRWFAYPLAWLWQLVNKLPSSDPFEPYSGPACNCDYCRGVPGAVWEP
jgi:hypothetical protein